MSEAAPVEVTAPAKLTWTLRVTGVRSDGYHLIEAEMVTLDLADRLEIGSGDGLVVVDPAGVAPGCDDGPGNLVRRGLSAVGRTASVTLHKAIPDRAGLGGGSADAAAILRWAGVSDAEVAVGLGADVPFCVVGGRARVGGVGERVEALPYEERRVTLVTPPLSVSTPAVYRAWDERPDLRRDGRNHLEEAAVAVEPRLAEWRHALREATGLLPALAGSGSTWWVEGHHAESLLAARWPPGPPPRLVTDAITRPADAAGGREPPSPSERD